MSGQDLKTAGDWRMKIALFIVSILTVMALSLYHAEKKKCAQYGQSYTMNIPSMDGVCISYLVDGTIIETPIELVSKIKYNPNNGKPGWRTDP